MTKNNKMFTAVFVITLALLPAVSFATTDTTDPEEIAQEILKATQVNGGLIIHIGCGDGKLTAALHAGDQYLVHGLDKKQKNVNQAREYIHSLKKYGPVSIDHLTGNNLPYIDNLVNLVVSEDLGFGSISMNEVMRVLCPEGVAYIRKDKIWTKTVKPRPKEIDDWTHYLHDASNNAVAHDSVIAPPERIQWMGSPRYSRHHDRMSSISGMVTAGGRVFYMFDEASPVSILIQADWALIARDAFNGTILWKRKMGDWHTHLWPLKSGPAQLPRRLVTDGDYVYATLSYDGPLEVFDAATGETVRTYEQTKGTEEVILSDGVLFAVVNPRASQAEFADPQKFNKGYAAKFWDEGPRTIVALNASTGKVLWTKESVVLPITLAANSSQVFFHDGEKIICLDHETGDQQWNSEPVERAEVIKSFYAPTLVVYKDVVLFSGGETAGVQTGSWYEKGKDTMTALSTKTGKEIWKSYHPPSGYRSPEDLLVAGGLVWTGETTSGRAEGVFTGRDPYTGVVKKEFSPDVDVYWFHHRCYRGKATDNYLIMSRTGTEFLDVKKETWKVNHWVRGACLYGIMPANGMLYNPPNPCACYHESKLYGFNAVAPALNRPRIDSGLFKQNRLQTGPAYKKGITFKKKTGDWPTYRHDPARSGGTATPVGTSLKQTWKAQIAQKITSPVIAEGKVFVASIETHTIHALDAVTGDKLWEFTAGGRVDSPPTIWKARVLFGSTDGWVYCLRASDGELVWRFMAAPMDQRLTSFEQLESVWPVHGSVLIQNDTLYCVAGRSMFTDGGLRFIRLDPVTGKLLSETVLDNYDADTGKDLHEYVTWLNMPTALPDILSSDGKLVYMRALPFELDGTRLPLEKMPSGKNADQGAPPATQRADRAHLFSPTGFLDDTWWHRTYWMYGSRFVSGWCGYFLSGKVAPAGKILAYNNEKIYGFGRKPQYYKWTTPIEHQLFSTDRVALLSDEPQKEPTGKSLITVEKSTSLNPANKPLTVEAWVKAEKAGGVIIAQGGSSQGYSLYLQGGKPFFAVRSSGDVVSAGGKKRILNKWVHLAGVLTAEKEIRIYVDGKLAGTGKAPGLVNANPAEGMQVGVDDGSAVAEYTSQIAFKGTVDDIKVFHRPLSDSEIKTLAAGTKNAFNKDELVLWYTFDKGNAADRSGNKNMGKIEGAVAVEGKFSKAIKFTGQTGAVAGFQVDHDWTQDLRMFPRAMVLAGDTLFLAGPEDIVDEPQAFRQISETEVKDRLKEQAKALAGEKGAFLLAVSTVDGTEISQSKLESTPVFDGMAAAEGRLYLSTVGGDLLCIEGTE